MVDTQQTLPQGQCADKNAQFFSTGGGQFFSQRNGDTESTGAGDHEEGNHDLQAGGNVAGADPPGDATEDGKGQDGEDVITQDAVEPGVAGFGFAGFAEAPVKRGVPAFHRFQLEGGAADVEAAGEEASAGGDMAGIGFAADGFEADAGFTLEDAAGDGDDLTGR